LTSKVTGPEVLFEASFPVHDTWVVPIGKVLPDVGLHVVVGDGSMASLAVATNDTAAPLPDVASCVIGPGTDKVGAVLSRTVTLNVPGGDELPDVSVAVQETPVTPTGKTLPELWLQAMSGDGSIASLAVTEKVTLAPAVDVASTANDAGTVMVGAVWSWTFTSKLAGADVLFALSFAVQETVVVPTGNIVPESLLHEMIGEDVTASLAVTVNETKAPPEPPAGTVIVPGTETTGGAVS
jgi:hypothetical protein